MKKFLNNLKEESSHIRMSHAEKTAMRAEIFGVSGVEMPQKSPYLFDSFFTYNTRMVMAGLLLFVLLGSGTVSAAAQNALPGDLLYPVKVSINERAEVALAPTPADKAVVQAQLAERRVDEAQTLASQGRLDAQTADNLSADFDAHAAQALALAGPDETTTEAPVVATADATPVEAPVSAPAPTMAMATMKVSVAVAPVSAPSPAPVSTTTAVMQAKVLREPSLTARLQSSLRLQADILENLKLRVSGQGNKDNPDSATSTLERVRNKKMLEPYKKIIEGGTSPEGGVGSSGTTSAVVEELSVPASVPSATTTTTTTVNTAPPSSGSNSNTNTSSGGGTSSVVPSLPVSIPSLLH